MKNPLIICGWLLCMAHAANGQPRELDTLRYEAVTLVSRYIQIASVTGNENEAGVFLAKVCRQFGLSVEVFSDEPGSYNFAASLYPLTSEKPNIIFLNHIDVVPPGTNAQWTHPPFSGVEIDSAIWGRGAIDMKGMTIMQLVAIKRFAEQSYSELPYNLTLLCVSQEETTGELGAQFVVANYFTKLNPIVVYGEGGAGIFGLIESRPNQPVFLVSTSEKQALWLKLSVKIESGGHGAVPPFEYANQQLVKALYRIIDSPQKIIINEGNVGMFKALGQIETGVMGYLMRNIRMLRPVVAGYLRRDEKVLSVVSNTVTVTWLINPPGAVNQIAQEAAAYLDCRLLPGNDADAFIEHLRNLIGNDHVSIERVLHTPSATPSSDQSIFYKALAQAITDTYPDAGVVPYVFPAYTDNNYFRQAGVPAYGINPVKLSQELLESIHNANERLPLQSLFDGIAVYERLLTHLMPQTNLSATKTAKH